MRARHLFIRTQPATPWRRIIPAAVAGGVTIGVLALVSGGGQFLLLAAAFGASCVLVFSLPDAPLSQPINVIGGHLVATASALLLSMFLPPTWWGIAIAVGVAMVLMTALRVTHPPAGADPIIVLTTGVTWSYLVTPILVGAIVIVLAGVVFHRLSGTAYPSTIPLRVREPELDEQH